MVTEQQIREMAYAIWEEEGRLEGKDREHYFRAKQMLEKSSPPIELQAPPVPPQLMPAGKTASRRRGKR